MKKRTYRMHRWLIAIFAVLTFTSGSVTSAQTTTATTSTSTNPSRGKTVEKQVELRDKLEERRDELRQKLEKERLERETKQAELKMKLKQSLKERIARQARYILNRHHQAIIHLKNIAGRLESRIHKLEEHGSNQNRAKAILAEALVKIRLAETLLEKARTDSDTLLVGDVTKDVSMKIRDILKGVETAIRAAHHALVEVIVTTRSADNLRLGLNASSTPATTTPPTTSITP